MITKEDLENVMLGCDGSGISIRRSSVTALCNVNMQHSFQISLWLFLLGNTYLQSLNYSS